MPYYDPLVSEVTVDVTISAVTYIVTAYNCGGASAVGADFQTSDGGYRGQRKTSGPRDGSMTIEKTNAAQAVPAQFVEFTYKGVTWIANQVSESASSNGPAAITLTLREKSAAEVAADA